MTDCGDTDFEAFVTELQLSSLVRRNPELRYQFCAKFAKELAFVSLYLNDLGVTGGEVEDHGGPPDTCDLCKCPIGEVGFFVDGQTHDGSWANMCPKCYMGHGMGIGWGIGQLYRNCREGRWRCIAGGNPNPQVND
jgi:hypothetical protein